MQQVPDRVVRTDGLQALTPDGDGQSSNRSAFAKRPTKVHSRHLAGRRLLVTGAILAVGASLLVACGNDADTASQVAPMDTKSGTAADGGTGLSLNPSIIGSYVVKGTPISPSAKATSSAKATPTTKQATPTASEQSSSPMPSTGPVSPTGQQGSGDPSGENPFTTLSGYSLKSVQEFTGNSIPSGWDAYNGTPGGVSAQQSQFAPSMCTFSGGEAQLVASGIDTCGLQYYGSPQVYGAWFARLQAPNEPSGVSVGNVFLLFPANNQWPPEIDIYEDHGTRTSTSASMYNTVGSVCGSSPTAQCLGPYAQSNGHSGGVANDDTQWHTYGVEWTPSGVTWLIDGRVVFTAPASQVVSPAQQPDTPMYMDLQSENTTGASAPTGTLSMSVDWAEEFSWNG
jgi:hypothetical protein